MKTGLNKDNGKKENRTSRKRSLIIYGVLALVVFATAVAAVQILPGGSDNTAAAGQWDGSGTQLDPYQIKDAADLKQLADDVNIDQNDYYQTYFILKNDIDLNVSPYNEGSGWEPIGYDSNYNFKGNFDGGWHTISGLTMASSAYTNNGLFGWISGGSVIDLGVINVSIRSDNWTGGVAGYCNGTIENCFVTGNIKGGVDTGGVVGVIRGTVDNCYNLSDVVGSTYVGGVAGDNNSGSIYNCYNNGTVTGNTNVGGVLGYNTGGGSIEKCYNSGAVSGNSPSGGVVGTSNGTSTVDNCFFLQSQDGSGINNGFHGIGSDHVTSTYSDLGAVGIDDSAMRTESTFTGWDFSSTGSWGLYPNDTAGGLSYGYPYISTIGNNVKVIPVGGSKVYDGLPAPDQKWSPEGFCEKDLFTGKLAYDPTPAINPKTYNITMGTLDSPYYQLRFKDDVQYTITAAPGPKSYTITPTSDANSTITPSKAVTVQSGSSYTFTYSAASGYHISSVIVNGTALDQSQITGSYTFTNVIYNQTIDVKSASGAGPSGTGTTVTLTVDIVGGNGMAEYRIGSGQYVSFTGAQLITVGSNLYVSVIADSGYSFVEWSGASTSKNAEVNFANVTNDIHLVAHLNNDNATGSAGKSGNFGIANLVLMILALIIGIIAIVVGVRKNAEGKASVTAAVAGLLTLVVGIASVIAFFLTEDLSASMTSTDNWTVWMAVLFVVAVVLAAVTIWFSKRNDS
ncbi:MAG: hypothetical protein FWF07_01670 [Methanomassiliicoccaceae archaeon]|nr:hypothetical protein [Methanomassiliicoccaceae archaeon]